MDTIYVINLERRFDRKITTQFKLNKLGLNPIFVKAVDGYTDENIKKFHIIKNNVDNCYINSPGAVGLLLTYYNILTEAIDNNYENILIFEDDVSFHKDFSLEIINNNKPTVDNPVVYLGANQYRWTPKMLEEINTGYYHTSSEKYMTTYGTFGIYINRSLFKTIQQKIILLSDFKYPIDVLINNILNERQKSGLVLYPNMVIADVSESNNMPARDQQEFSKSRKWDLNNYYYVSNFDMNLLITQILNHSPYNIVEDITKYISNNTSLVRFFEYYSVEEFIVFIYYVYGTNRSIITDNDIYTIRGILNTHNISLRQLLFRFERFVPRHILFEHLQKEFKKIGDYQNLDILIEILKQLIIDPNVNIMDLYKIIELSNKSFCIVIPSYNNDKIYKQNLESIFKQNYWNYRVIYIDDCSEDKTFKRVQKFINSYKLENKFLLLQQYTRQRQCAARYIAYHMAYDDEILVMLDGDDWLYDNQVLTKLNDFYKNNDILVSYGSFYEFSNGQISTTLYGKRNYPPEIKLTRDYRNYDWISSHLRTGYAKLFKNINLEDLLDESGKFYELASDFAEMIPVLEMSGDKNLNICEPMYVYNKENSILYNTSYYRKDEHDNSYYKNYREVVTKRMKERRKYPVINMNDQEYTDRIDTEDVLVHIISTCSFDSSCPCDDGLNNIKLTVIDDILDYKKYIDPCYTFTVVTDERIEKLESLVYYINLFNADAIFWKDNNLNSISNYVTADSSNNKGFLKYLVKLFTHDNDKIRACFTNITDIIGLFRTDKLINDNINFVLFNI